MINILHPPIFQDNDKTLNASLLHTIIWSFMLTGVTSIFIAVAIPETFFRWLLLIAFIEAMGFILLYLNNIGYTKSVINLLIIAIWIAATVMAYTGGGIRSNAMVIYIIAVLIAGLLQSGKLGLATAAFCSFTSLSLVYLEHKGLLPASSITHNSFTLWIAFTAYMVIIIVLQFLFSRTMREALKNLRQEINNRFVTEEALRESELRFRSLFETSSQGILIYKKDGIIQAVNPAMMKIMGADSPENIEDHPYLGFIHIDDREESRARIDKIFSSVSEMPDHVSRGQIAAPLREHRMVKLNGDVIDVESTSIAFEHKNSIYIQGIFRDISERKRAEDALKESEEKYRLVIENAREAIVITQDFKLVFVNPAAVDITGYSEEILTSTPFAEFIHPDDRNMVIENHRKRMKGEEIIRIYSYRLIDRNGRVKWVETNAVSIDWKGRPATLIFLKDITESKQAEEMLRQSEEKYRALYNNAQVSLFRTRIHDGKLIEVNKRYAEKAGYSTVEDCMADFNAVNAWVDPSRREAMVKILREKGSINDYEAEIVRRDGTHMWISFSATIYPDQGVIEGSIIDITERKAMEEERLKMERQLLQSQKMEAIGTLAGGIAHDFNNMLGVILGRAEMALGKIKPSQQLYSDVMEIYRAAQRSASLTRQLLAFARKQTISPRVLDLNEILQGMSNMLERLIGEDINLAWLPGADLWSVNIDPSQIDQILANLCVNARDAITGVGKITIETANITFDEFYCVDHPDSVPGDYVLLAVSDNGCGMDKEMLGKLFEPFYTTKELGKGTGLGLSTVYGIVRQNSGFINVYSELDHGTTFKIYFPRYEGEDEIAKVDGDQATVVSGHETVLVVEDEPALLELSKLMLEMRGYKVLSASTPNEAIRLGREHTENIDLLITDVVMPEMNGRDLAENMCTLYPGLKCLFTSGYTANVIAHHGVLDAGVHFIQKPFSIKDLTLKVREVLDNSC